MKFILSRTDDYESHSKKWIVGYGLLFWFITRIIAMIVLMGCMAVYKRFGLNPEQMTQFAGNPETAKTLGSTLYVLCTVTLVAPLLEECIFRLGLSFRRIHIAIGLAAIPLYVMWQHNAVLTFLSATIYIAIIGAVFCSVFFLTSNEFWLRVKRRYYNLAIWLTAFGFGLIHLIAFSHYSFALLPYMLCVIAMPFFAGCAITYYRVNLGFWWGVGLHVFNNLPAIFLLLNQ